MIGTDDGVTVEFYARGLTGDGPFAGCNLEVHGFSPELCRLVLDLTRAGGLVITHDGEPDAVLLTDEGGRGSLPNDLRDHPKLLVCPTPESLETALEGGFEAWRAFRDRAVQPPRA